MDDSQFKALLEAAQVEKEGEWSVLTGEKTLTLHVSSGGVGLAVSKVVRLRVVAGLLQTENQQGDLFLVSIAEVFAGSIHGRGTKSRQAGFRA